MLWKKVVDEEFNDPMVTKSRLNPSKETGVYILSGLQLATPHTREEEHYITGLSSLSFSIHTKS